MDDLDSAEEDFGEELQPWESSRFAILSWLHCLLAITLSSSLVSKPLLPETEWLRCHMLQSREAE